MLRESCRGKVQAGAGASRKGRPRGQAGQSLVEYLLLTAMLATSAAAFSKFYGQKVLGEGLKRLPGKVSLCVSHGVGPESCK